MPMIGSKLRLEIRSEQPSGLGAPARYSGKVMGRTFDFSEPVTEYVPTAKRCGITAATWPTTLRVLT